MTSTLIETYTDATFLKNVHKGGRGAKAFKRYTQEIWKKDRKERRSGFRSIRGGKGHNLPLHAKGAGEGWWS